MTRAEAKRRVIDAATAAVVREARALVNHPWPLTGRAGPLKDAIAAYDKVGGPLLERSNLARLKERIDLRLNSALVEMKEGWDDSIVGFNAAWDIVRGVFDALPNTGEVDEWRPIATDTPQVGQLCIMGWFDIPATLDPNIAPIDKLIWPGKEAWPKPGSGPSMPTHWMRWSLPTPSNTGEG